MRGKRVQNYVLRVVICCVIIITFCCGISTSAGGYAASKLYRVSDGYEKIDFSYTDGLTIEKYDNTYKLVSTKRIDSKYILPTGCDWDNIECGGSYECEKYNYIVTGRDNFDESESLVTFRLSKFTKNWEYVSCCETSKKDDVEIYEIFRASGFSMTEMDGKIWVSFGRTGFNEGDGYHHQGKMNILVDESTMTLLGSASDFWHSFDQYQVVCNGKMYQMELSEGSRTVYMENLSSDKYTGGWTHNFVAGSSKYIKVFDFWEKDNGIWSYGLGGSTYDFEASDGNSKLLGIIVSMDQDDLQKNEGNSDSCYNVYIAITGTDLGSTKLVKLTSYTDKNVQEAYITKINDDKFLITWRAYDSGYNNSIYYQYIDSNGNTLSTVKCQNDIIGLEKPVVDGQGNVTWFADGEETYFYGIDSKGVVHSYPEGYWKKDSRGWWYRNPDGTYPKSCFKSINGSVYAFNSNGYMITGWVNKDSWYYFGTDGAMITGWGRIGGRWFYFNQEGVMITGWIKLGSTWYYLKSDGAMATGWNKLGSKWYYFNPDGAMAVGWKSIGNRWFYLESGGAMSIGWKKISNQWYYFDKDGAMVTGWKSIDGKWYYFNGIGEWKP